MTKIAIISEDELTSLKNQLTRIEQKLSHQPIWISLDDFVKNNPSVQRRTVMEWRRSGAIKTKKIGKTIFIDQSKMFE